MYQDGIAFGTDLRAAAIASNWVSPAYALSFNLTIESFLVPYQRTFGVADVVNSSFGFTDPDGTDALSVVMDAYAFQNPLTTYVTSAGNSGPGSNTVGSPGSDYNAITVGALTNANTFDAVASFSSRAPQDFGYIDASGTTVSIAGVRAAVDLSAPGASLIAAFWGGQAGGNNPTLTSSTNQGTSTNLYSLGMAGTSFAAPLVAGGAALVVSAAKTLPVLASNPVAAQSMVVKSLLLTGADKTAGWSNGQQTVTVGGTTYIRTTQSLDYAAGAGRMDLATTFGLQVGGQIDVVGTGTGISTTRPPTTPTSPRQTSTSRSGNSTAATPSPRSSHVPRASTTPSSTSPFCSHDPDGTGCGSNIRPTPSTTLPVTSGARPHTRRATPSRGPPCRNPPWPRRASPPSRSPR